MRPRGGVPEGARVVAGALGGLLVGALAAGVVARRPAPERDPERRAREAAVAALESARADAAAARGEAAAARQAADLVASGARRLLEAEALGPAPSARAAWSAAAEALRAARALVDTPAVREALARALVGLGEAELPADAAAARGRFAAAAELLGEAPPALRARALVGLVEAARAARGAGDGGAPAQARAGLAAGTPGRSAGEAPSREAGERPRGTHDADGLVAEALAAARAAVAASGRPDAVRALARGLLLAATTAPPPPAAVRRELLGEAVERARELTRAGQPPRLLAEALEGLAPLSPADEVPALLDEALRARRALRAAADPGDAQAGRALVRALIELAAVDARRGLALLGEAVGLARQQADQRPLVLEDRELLVAALEAEARARAEVGDRAGARVGLEQALRAARALAAAPGAGADPDDAGRARTIVRLLLALGPALARDRDLPGARRALEDAAQGARALLERDAADALAAADLVLALLHLASLDQEQGQQDDARARLEEACDTARLAPGDARMSRALGLALWRLSGLDLAAGELDRAVARLEEALVATREAGVQLDGLTAALEQARGRRELVRGAAPATTAEQLQQAYALLALGDPAAATARFEAALEEPAVRADVGRGHLHHAARAAAQAGQRARALEWLAEDVRRRRERIAALERATASADLDDEERAAAARERDRLLRHLDHARRAEPAFAPLRGAPEFEGLFE